jgi:hypothetical protein
MAHRAGALTATTRDYMPRRGDAVGAPMPPRRQKALALRAKALGGREARTRSRRPRVRPLHRSRSGDPSLLARHAPFEARPLGPPVLRPKRLIPSTPNAPARLRALTLGLCNATAVGFLEDVPACDVNGASGRCNKDLLAFSLDPIEMRTMLYR